MRASGACGIDGGLPWGGGSESWNANCAACGSSFLSHRIEGGLSPRKREMLGGKKPKTANDMAGDKLNRPA
jgi:hypothetical protein